MKSQDQLKHEAALAAVKTIQSPLVLGVGTGSTVEYLIAALPQVRHLLDAVVSSSQATENLLRQQRLPVTDLNAVCEVDVYIDGADEINRFLQMIKGGGGALTREKIIAASAKKFICIADESKQVDVLGEKFPLPIEVIPMARSFVAREMVKRGGDPHWRENVITDNGHHILDVYHLPILEPVKFEKELNNVPGIVTHGLFALRPADELILATQNGIVVIPAKVS